MLHRLAKIALRNIFATDETFLLPAFTQLSFGFTQQLFRGNRITEVREYDYRDAGTLLQRRCNDVTKPWEYEISFIRLNYCYMKQISIYMNVFLNRLNRKLSNFAASEEQNAYAPKNWERLHVTTDTLNSNVKPLKHSKLKPHTLHLCITKTTKDSQRLLSHL